MTLTDPIIFEPIFMERVWGGRRLETLYHKQLPNGDPIGESWEIADREEAQSVVHNGPLRGKTLNELWRESRTEIFGARFANSQLPRFPLLIKLLDAEQRLSMQVHPSAASAKELGGECKTEFWYVLHTQPNSDIFAGFENAITREDFERAISENRVTEKIHRIPTQSGDAIFIPSGLIHAIGAGNMIFEVQQNSDTTYRVFDWNRLGLDGKPRELHIAESLKSIDFDYGTPSLVKPKGDELVRCDYFRVERWELSAPRKAASAEDFAIITCLEGEIGCCGVRAKEGEFFLVPASLANREVFPVSGTAKLLRTTIPS